MMMQSAGEGMQELCGILSIPTIWMGKVSLSETCK